MEQISITDVEYSSAVLYDLDFTKDLILLKAYLLAPFQTVNLSSVAVSPFLTVSH